MAESNQHKTLQEFKKNAIRHSESQVSGTWWSPTEVAARIESLNAQNNKIKSNNKKITALQKDIGELTAKDTLTDYEKERLDQWVTELKTLEADTEKLQEDYNKNKDEAQQFLKLKTKAGGRIVAVYKDDNRSDNNTYQTYEIGSMRDLQKLVPQSGLVHPIQQYMYSDDAAATVVDIIDSFESGNYEPIDNEKFLKLAAAGYNLKGDAYNILTNNIVDVRFRYNIKRNFNEKLNDIRNIRTFRASNINDVESGSKLNIAGNFINPTTVDGTNGSKSFYMSRNDFYWSENYNDITDLESNMVQRQSVQNIILNEYQPSLLYDIGRQVFQGLDNYAGGKVDDLTSQALDNIGMGGMKNLFTAGANHLVEKMYNDKLQQIGNRPEKLYAEENYEDKTNPMYYVEHLFNNGTWLNTYELPFVDNGQVKTDYLKNSTDPGKWDIGGLTDGLGEDSLVQTVLTKKITLSLPTSPTFQLNNPHNATMGDFNISFYLINKDDFYLDKNFQFMQALFAGTQWLNMDFGTVVATNVYHVLVPGRFAIQWASMGSEFQAMGKLRTNDWMYDKYANGNIKIGMIDYDTLWPDAWHVTLKIHPLSLWNFNTHMAYYLHGFGPAQRNRLAEMKSSWMNTIAGLQNQKNKIQQQNKRKNGLIEQAKGLLGQMSDALTTMERLAKKGNLSDKEYKEFLEAKDAYLGAKTRKEEILQKAKQFDNEWLDMIQETGGNVMVEESQLITTQVANSFDQQKNYDFRLQALTEGDLKVTSVEYMSNGYGTQARVTTKDVNLQEATQGLVREKSFEQLQEQMEKMNAYTGGDMRALTKEQRDLYEKNGFFADYAYNFGAYWGGSYTDYSQTGDANKSIKNQTLWEQSVLNNSQLTNTQKEELLYASQQKRAEAVHNSKLDSLRQQKVKQKDAQKVAELDARIEREKKTYQENRATAERQHQYKLRSGGRELTEDASDLADKTQSLDSQIAAQKAKLGTFKLGQNNKQIKANIEKLQAQKKQAIESADVEVRKEAYKMSGQEALKVEQKSNIPVSKPNIQNETTHKVNKELNTQTPIQTPTTMTPHSTSPLEIKPQTNLNKYMKRAFFDNLTVPQQMKVTNGAASWSANASEDSGSVSVNWNYKGDYNEVNQPQTFKQGTEVYDKQEDKEL